MIPRTSAASACLAFLLALLPGWATTAGAQAVPYTLSVGAEFATGCFTPDCSCGRVQNAMTGEFVLQRQPPDAQFAHYLVNDINWLVQFPTGFVAITGTGTYRMGGTPVLQQQMTLDLSIGSGKLLHFDSGLVLGGDNFPRLAIDVPLHGFCIDTLLRVRAGPGSGTAGVPPVALAPGAITPNPFRAGTRLAFALRDAGPVRISVHDVAGRTLRTLADGAWLAGGAQAVVWDGRRDDGRPCAPGCYFLRISAGGATERRAVVKLE